MAITMATAITMEMEIRTPNKNWTIGLMLKRSDLQCTRTTSILPQCIAKKK
jgi:hypothetical protein